MELDESHVCTHLAYYLPLIYCMSTRNSHLQGTCDGLAGQQLMSYDVGSLALPSSFHVEDSLKCAGEEQGSFMEQFLYLK